MPKMSVAFAMTLLVLGNIIAVFSDALIKDFLHGQPNRTILPY